MSDPARGTATPDPLTRRIRSTPDRTALVDAATGEAWRYDELDASVADVAGRLAGLGLGPGDYLGLLSGTSIGAIRTIHAAWRLGLRLVPLSVRLTDAELERRIARCRLDGLVCDTETAGTARAVVDAPVATLGSGAASGHDADQGSDEGPPALSTVASSTFEAATWRSDDIALVLFTSGTTGEPKGVDLTMGNLRASATASAFRLGTLPTDRWLLCLPVYHMGGLAPVLRSALYGTTLVVQEGFDANDVAVACRTHDVTGLSLVPTQLRRILDADERFGETVRTVLLGGAPAPAALLDRCRRLDVPVYPTYGLTETASQVATATPEQAFEHVGTVGQPLFGTAITIVDENRGSLPAGETGEIAVSGPTVTPGYHDDPETTERAFCRHGLLTGDLGHLDEDGRLWVSGRRTDRIVTGGENVDPAEVVGAIREHGSVADAAVVGLPDPEWGQRVAALVVTTSGASLDAEELLASCRGRLAAFKLPKSVVFAESLPRTASGTVDRDAVRRRLLDESRDSTAE